VGAPGLHGVALELELELELDSARKPVVGSKSSLIRSSTSTALRAEYEYEHERKW